MDNHCSRTGLDQSCKMDCLHAHHVQNHPHLVACLGRMDILDHTEGMELYVGKLKSADVKTGVRRISLTLRRHCWSSWSSILGEERLGRGAETRSMRGIAIELAGWRTILAPLEGWVNNCARKEGR